MHYVFYVIGGVSMLAAGWLAVDGLAKGNAAEWQTGLYVFLGATLWLGIGRALELMERIADAAAPLPETHPDAIDRPAQTPQDASFRRGL